MSNTETHLETSSSFVFQYRRKSSYLGHPWPFKTEINLKAKTIAEAFEASEQKWMKILEDQAKNPHRYHKPTHPTLFQKISAQFPMKATTAISAN